ncbi:MAG: hypothetical protein JW939_00235, partial [Candidatus Thermoplasmatota archaeon]|nr:hypothetical protein [Candidatus Thermoplasmatota archaeon]
MTKVAISTTGHRGIAVLLVLVLALQMAVILPKGVPLKPLASFETVNAPMSLVSEFKSLGDFDRDGYVDVIMTMPTNASNGLDSGAVFIFWGSQDGFGAFEPQNADIIILGEENYLLGQAVIPWDYAG